MSPGTVWSSHVTFWAVFFGNLSGQLGLRITIKYICFKMLFITSYKILVIKNFLKHFDFWCRLPWLMYFQDVICGSYVGLHLGLEPSKYYESITICLIVNNLLSHDVPIQSAIHSSMIKWCSPDHNSTALWCPKPMNPEIPAISEISRNSKIKICN